MQKEFEVCQRHNKFLFDIQEREVFFLEGV